MARRSRRPLLLLTALLGTAALVGCGVTPPSPRAERAIAAPAAAAAASSISPGPAPRPANLAGLAPRDLVALLGQPDFRRVEPPAELWQYRSADCILDIFLYSDGDTGDYHVVHSETRERRQTMAVGGGCRDGAAGVVDRLRQSRL
jgi:hypothetical protein